MSGHALDWFNQPSVYKTYPDIEVIPLKETPQFPGMSLSRILKGSVPPKVPSNPSFDELSQFLNLSYSFTAKAVAGNGTFYYRSVASAGALYPTEIYLAIPESLGLSEGIYHYSIAQAGLSKLREGHFSCFISPQVLWPEGVVPGLTFFLTVIFFRSSWKYRERAFRYHLLDTGHVIEHVLLALSSFQYPSTLTYDFNDHDINRLLGLDELLEGTLAVISLPASSSQANIDFKPIDELPLSIKKASRTAQKETLYPLINKCYKAGGLTASTGKDPLSQAIPVQIEPKNWGRIIPPENWPENLPYAQSVFRRRSKRNFVPERLPSQTFGALLEGLSLEIPGVSQVPEEFNSSLTLGLLTGSVEGVDPGFYLFDKNNFKLGLIKEGRFTQAMARVCLDQMWLAQASVHFLFLGSPEELDNHGGPRGYRYVMMTAGRMGERLYLLATALELGCCGIGAFYDQEAADLLGLDEGYRLLYLVAVGIIKRKIV
jgi:SagB-type dehydrogenase family enzyme